MKRWPLQTVERPSHVLIGGVCQGDDNVSAAFDTDGAAVQADIIILGHTPCSAGVMLVINAASLILFLQPSQGALFGITVKADDTLLAKFHIRIDKGMEAIRAVFENIIRVSANDNAGAFFGKLQNHAALNIPEEIRG